MLHPKQLGRFITVPNVLVSGTVNLPVSVDNYRAIVFEQTTPGISVQLPSPTYGASPVCLDVINKGTTPINVSGFVVLRGNGSRFAWLEGRGWLLVNHRTIDAFVAAASITLGSVVRLGGDGKIYAYDSPNANFYTLIGIALNNAGAGDSVAVATHGKQGCGFTGLEVGASYYAESNGSLTKSVTDYFVGLALSPTTLLVLISNNNQVKPEYGVQQLGGIHTSSSLYPVPENGVWGSLVQFSLPTAGVWRVETTCIVDNLGSSDVISGIMCNATGEIEQLSLCTIGYSSNSCMATGTVSFKVTTQGAETFSLCVKKTQGTGSNVYSGQKGLTRVSWEKVAGFLPQTQRSFTAQNTITASSNPVKASNPTVDFITVTDNASGLCRCDLDYRQVLGGGKGNGYYEFSLPAGCKFDLSTYTPHTTAGILPKSYLVDAIPASVLLTGDLIELPALNAVIVVRSATTFSIYTLLIGQSGFVGADYYGLDTTNLAIKLSFRFKKG